MSRVIVVGGGIIGLSAALALQLRGWRVRLLDEGASAMASSWGNAGHIAVEQVEPLASRATIAAMPRRLFSRGGAAAFPPSHARAWIPFGLRLLGASAPARFAAGQAALERLCNHALPAWRAIVAAIGRSDLLIEQGHLLFWETPKSALMGMAGWTARPTGTATMAPVSEAELNRVQGLMRIPLANGIRFTGSASITDLPTLREVLHASFVGGGGEFVRSPVARLSDLDAERIVVAAGFGSAKLMRAIGHRVPMIAERGYHAHAASTDWPIDMPPLVLEDRALILTRFRDGLRAASFVELGRDADNPDPRKWERIDRHVAELGIRFDDVTRWMGARPTLPDYLPAIGRSTRDPRVVYAFGHQHLGLTLGPLTGALVASIVDRTALEVPIAPFSLERFA